MPLHLLGKKSWNIYNRDNIERVRRDEADAQAREEEQDRRTQVVDSERRLRLLRGERVDDLPAKDTSAVVPSKKDDRGHSRKRRRLAGEDDTDRDMRLAREEAVLQAKKPATQQATNEPLTDTQGHINLFPANLQSREQNADAEAERAKRRREYEDQYTMRFSNAAGFKQDLSAPWYSSTGKDNTEMPGKDVWGNDDIGRREREQVRANANDPLATMKRGVKQLRDVERSRKDWIAERQRELAELKALEVSRSSDSRHRKRRRRGDDSDVLEGFDLNDCSKAHNQEDRHHRHRSRLHRSGSRSGRRHEAHDSTKLWP